MSSKLPGRKKKDNISSTFKKTAFSWWNDNLFFKFKFVKGRWTYFPQSALQKEERRNTIWWFLGRQHNIKSCARRGCTALNAHMGVRWWWKEPRHFHNVDSNRFCNVTVQPQTQKIWKGTWKADVNSVLLVSRLRCRAPRCRKQNAFACSVH